MEARLETRVGGAGDLRRERPVRDLRAGTEERARARTLRLLRPPHGQQLTRTRTRQCWSWRTAPPPLLLDVREPWEFEICRIDGSRHIPMRQIPERH
jgi:hypothetical protein